MNEKRNCESSKIYRHLYILFTLNTWFKICIYFLTGRSQIILFRYLQYFDLPKSYFLHRARSPDIAINTSVRPIIVSLAWGK